MKKKYRQRITADALSDIGRTGNAVKTEFWIAFSIYLLVTMAKKARKWNLRL